MSGGKITRFQNNVRIDGDLDLSNSTGLFTLSSLSSAPSSPTVGESYYDSTQGKARIYQITGWTNVDGTAAGSLDAAYNGGATITVDGGAVTLTDSQTNTAGGLLITKSGIVGSSSSNSIFHINSTATHTSSGTMKMIELSCAADSGSQTQIGVEIEMAANTDSGITLTKGAVTLSDGAMTLTSGTLTLTSGDLVITSGSLTYTLGDMTMADGSLTITDADAATTLSITNDSVATADLVSIASTGITTTGAMMKINANATTHDGMILELISAGDATSTPTGISLTIADVTTGVAKGIDVVMAGSTTQAKGISVTMDALTTGDMLYLDNGGGSITGDGKFINCNDDDVSVFSVAVAGLTTIKGNASGTDALVLTAGENRNIIIITVNEFSISRYRSSTIVKIKHISCGKCIHCN